MQSQPNSSNTPNNVATRFNKLQNVSRATSVIPFDFDGGAIRVITDELGDPWFVARDVADALGYAKPENAISRHCKAATTTPKQGGGFMTVIPERDVYRLVMRSKLTGAERFEEWVVGEVLPSIRKSGKFEAVAQGSSKVVGELALMECYTRLLKPSPSSQVMMLAKIATNNGLESSFLPAYAIDAAPDASGGSSMPTKAITFLIKDNGFACTTRAFNLALEAHGFLKQLQRKNSKQETVDFWSVTEKGLAYGKNLTSPQCPRETQPHWYVERFPELAKLVGKA